MTNPLSYPETVARAVRAAIDDAGVSVLQVSEGALIPYTTLGRRLAGQPFTVEELARIARFLEVPIQSLTAPSAAA